MYTMKNKFKESSALNTTRKFYYGKLDVSGFLRFLFCFWLLFFVTAYRQGCDKNQCKGPIRFYEELKCKPIYEKKGDCCASRYNCSHLHRRSTDSCFINCHKYDIGEKLRDDDRSTPCDLGCTCIRAPDGTATFNCAVVDCFNSIVKKGCYFKRRIDSCCNGEEICPKIYNQRFQCEIEGETYLDGEIFSFKHNPELHCLCTKGFNKKNLNQFCRKYKCGIELRHSSKIRSNCAPVFEYNQKPQTHCAFQYRCQNEEDVVIHNENAELIIKSGEDELCQFGNLKLHVGDELKQATDYESICVKCVCEVPPTITCKRLSSDECDMSVHPPFF